MKCTLRRTEDLDEIKDLHKLAFAADHWPGDDHEFWIAKNPIGRPVGFCSALYFPEHKGIYLSRAAVALEARGEGLQRRMVRARLNWAKRETGAVGAWTFVKTDNQESLINLLRCGFRMGPLHLGGKYMQFYKPFFNNPDWPYIEIAKKIL